VTNGWKFELSGLDQFFRTRTAGERVIGTYLYPLCLLSEPDWHDPYSATEVVDSVQAESKEILITRMSGLFVRPPQQLSNPYTEPVGSPPADDLEEKLAFEEDAAQVFNRVICEFCLLGVVSQPTSPVHISFAQLIDQHILIASGSGGRESYWERSIAPAEALLRDQEWRTWPLRPQNVLEKASSLTRANRLAKISPSLPEFVAGAYSLYSQRQMNEALADSWVVCEQLLNHLWLQYRGQMTDQSRKKRLGDNRTYSASVKLEVLRTAGVLPDPLYRALHKARAHRNDLMHGATNSLDATSECMTAMKMTLEHILGEEVAQPAVSIGVNW
jgi:hypothetical protein